MTHGRSLMMMQEGIIFALCLGVGGHIALGVVMHDPSLWPWSTTGFYGLLSGLAVYGLVQTGRGVWKLFRHPPQFPSKDGPNALS
ncbi:MAG: hypothetical protein HY281_14940 [Nitrospirae bacterium]|nr:hypothetical protein [Nitrospirota bacterium]